MGLEKLTSSDAASSEYFVEQVPHVKNFQVFRTVHVVYTGMYTCYMDKEMHTSDARSLPVSFNCFVKQVPCVDTRRI